MSGNVHVTTAEFYQKGVHDWQGEEGQTDATHLATIIDAQTEATLALAFEQKTANMIAYLNGEGIAQPNREARAIIQTDVERRLGLRE